jgi:hypothetical protein
MLHFVIACLFAPERGMIDFVGEPRLVFRCEAEKGANEWSLFATPELHASFTVFLELCCGADLLSSELPA